MNIEPSSTRYCCILLFSLRYVETCFDGSRPEREQPGSVNCKWCFLSPLLFAAQITFCADCIHIIERESLYPGAAFVYIAVLHYVPNIFCIIFAVYLVGRGTGMTTQRSRRPTTSSPLLPSSLHRHDSLSSFTLSSGVQVSNTNITTVPSSSVSTPAAIGESVQKQRSGLRMNAAGQ
jgi:hypothetical protein